MEVTELNLLEHTLNLSDLSFHSICNISIFKEILTFKVLRLVYGGKNVPLLRGQKRSWKMKIAALTKTTL